MNHKEYLNLLSEDLNIVFRNEQSTAAMPQREKEHYFRVKILIFHLHVDYLLSEIIKARFQLSLHSDKNQEAFEVNRMEFIEKLRIFHAINRDEGLFTALRILNNVRNDLSHNLIVDLAGQEDKIRNLDISIIRGGNIASLSVFEHLLFGTLTYINALAEYLYNSINGENLDWILSVNISRLENTTQIYPTISVIRREIIRQLV